ncbi:hypothetical protein HZH68_011691 [Vespula germanica]|uniref:Uncharacterized protein n=1 Tax=Vespula germanica TaxID=30212 RepID=A0A834JN40_VESGE|nr:hypothetical protein HZH68_011691 [Vespula germanica]
MEICKEENYREHLMKIRWEVKIGGRCVRVLTVVSAFDARQDEKQQASKQGTSEVWLEINAIETGLDNELIIRRPRDDYQINYEVLTVHLVLYGNGSRIHLRDKVAKLVASNLPVVSIIVNVIIRRRKQVNGVSRANSTLSCSPTVTAYSTTATVHIGFMEFVDDPHWYIKFSAPMTNSCNS